MYLKYFYNFIFCSDTKFTTANQVYLHACEVHCPESIDETICQWDRCDNMKRKRFSMMTHLYDKHCNQEVNKHFFNPVYHIYKMFYF